MPTKDEFKIKAQEFSSTIQDAFNKWADYNETLRFDKYENKQGQNRHATVLFNKFLIACEAEHIDTMRASAILGNARD